MSKDDKVTQDEMRGEFASLTLRIASVQLLGSRGNGGDSPAPDQSAGATYTPNAASTGDENMADDLPF